MKKPLINISVIVLTLVFLVLCGQPAFAQSNSSDQTWTKIVSPVAIGDVISSVTISPDGVIYATSANLIHVSNDIGATWTTSVIPFPSAYIDHALWFKGRLYVGCETGIISTEDGQNWELSKTGYGFPSICANTQYAFFFGLNNNGWRTDGQTWVHINQPNQIVSVACADDIALTAFSNGEIYQSHDNGQTWMLTSQLDIDPISASANAGQYNVVGFTPDHKLSSRGQYQYDYSSGYLMAVTYFDGDCFFAGSENLSSSTYRGIIFKNGDLNNAAYFDGEIIGLTGNSNLMIANVLGCDLYVLTAKSASLPVYSDKSSLTVYPNPAINKIFVESSTNQLAKLYAISGQILEEYWLIAGKNYLDISNLKSGTYLLVGKEAVKIVKQ
ncbi:MAG: T9SS type A sorting domain-containing protein [Patescibacteria group bacterium]|jgi:photosystem II stability/assembly factor-like uncharacterized protein